MKNEVIDKIFIWILFIVLIILKLTSLADISWVWVFSPILLPLFLSLLLLLFGKIVKYVSIKKYKKLLGDENDEQKK